MSEILLTGFDYKVLTAKGRKGLRKVSAKTCKGPIKYLLQPSAL